MHTVNHLTQVHDRARRIGSGLMTKGLTNEGFVGIYASNKIEVC